MGKKEEQMEKDARDEMAWRKVAEENDLRCSRCGILVPRSEETMRYVSGLCSLCLHVLEKDE